MALAVTEDAAPRLEGFRAALDFAAAQAQRILSNYPGYTPVYTVAGKWHHEGEHGYGAAGRWSEGFFPGFLWLLHAHTGDERWAAAARALSRCLEPRRF